MQVSYQRSKNILVGGLKGVSPGAAVETFADRTQLPKDSVAPVPANVKVVARDGAGNLGYRNGNNVDAVNDDRTSGVCHLTFTVTVRWGTRTDAYAGLELDPAHSRSISRVLQAADPADELSLVWLDLGTNPGPTADLLTGLLAQSVPAFLQGGSEGEPLSPAAIAGEPADPDEASVAATGLAALADVEDVAIVACPDSVRFSDLGEQQTVVNSLVGHAEAPKAYRIAIVDPPRESSISQVRQFRSQFDSTYAALYYPWMEIIDPTAKNDPGAAPATLQLPPSGFTAGIYARSDIARGVHKAPANEVVLGITRFMQNVTYDRQAVLNPEGVNALRFFEGRANRVWGARTMS